MEKQFKFKRFHSLSYEVKNVWQLLYPEHIVNLLLVHHIKQQRNKQAVEVLGNSLIHNDISSSQVFESFQSINNQLYYRKFETTEISNMFVSFESDDGSTIKPKYILIEGAPGMGKTTLSKEITYLWSTKKLLVDCKMMFLLFLHDPALKMIKNLSDFIHYFYNFNQSYLSLSCQCAEILTRRDNSDITILMDGYDELDEEIMFINNIIERKVLSQCKVVITSRAIRSGKLQKHADVRVEILGFTGESKMSYIQEEFKNQPNKITNLLSYLRNHEDIDQLCNVPIIMSILVCTYKQYAELPNSQSDLYKNFIFSTILHYVQKLKDKHDLFDESMKYMQQFSKFAFKTIESGKIIFSDVDIERLCPSLALSSKKFQGLGLFKATKHLNFEKANKCDWYNFLHSTIHEFLAAYYLASLSHAEQFEFFRKAFFVERYINVWVMFVDLQKNLSNTLYQFLIYSADKEQIFQKLHQHGLHEIGSLNISDINCTFQLLCSKSNEEDLQTDMIYEKFIAFDSWCLLPFTSTSKWTKLFASLCCVDSSGPLIEVYLLDKNTREILYHQLVKELKQNQNISVTLVSSSALVGYRSNYYQLTSTLNMNGSLECIVLKYCLINIGVANALSSYFISCHYPKYLCINDCKIDQAALVIILQALMKISKINLLDLHGNNISGRVMKDIAAVIKNNPNLEELCLSHNKLKTSVTIILQALQKNSKLKGLHLNSSNVTEDVTEELANVIENNPNLEQLGLGSNKLGSSVFVILQALAKKIALKSLNLTSNNVTWQMAKPLAKVIESNPNLNRLQLSNNMLGPSAKEILKALGNNHKLKVLHLQNNYMTEQVGKDLANVFKNHLCLEEILLSGNHLKSAMFEILQALTENTKLKSLDLSSNDMSGQVADCLGNVMKKNCNLQQLVLADNNLGPSVIVVLKALAQNYKLTLLNLNNNDMSEKVAEYLASVIKNNFNLKYLGLANNSLGPSALCILQALKDHKKLQILHLDKNNMTGQVAEALASVIKNNTGLEEIWLSYNDLKLSTSAILQALKENSNLEILDLSNNNITGEIAEDLASVIKNNLDLKQLNLGNNKLGPSTSTILQALKGNSKLTLLNLNCNNMTGEVKDDLASVIKNNPGLEKLYLSENDFKLSAVLILQALKGNSKLRFLDLNSNNMTGRVAKYLAAVIKNNPNLEQLGLRNNNLGNSAVIILQALTKSCKLEVLNLNNNNMGEIAGDLGRIIKNNPNLHEFYFSGSDLKSSAVIILQALRTVEQLEIVSFTNNSIPNSFPDNMESHKLMNEIIKKNFLITELWLGGNMLQQGLLDIVESCKNLAYLKVMEVSYNYINATEVANLALLVSKISSLKVLMFDGIVLNIKERLHFGAVFQFYDTSKQINGNDDELLEITCLEMWRLQFANRIKFCYDVRNYFSTDLVATQVMDFYTKLNSWPLLSIVKNSKLTLSSLDAAKMIGSLYSIIKTAKVLDLGYNNIEKEAANKLAEVLKSNIVLEQLWLRGNKLSDSVSLILTSLQSIVTLRVLDLSFNGISSVSADGIAAVITSNYLLEQLWLDSNTLMTKGIVKIARVLKKHSNLKLLSLSSNGITEDAAEEVSALINNNTSLKGLLLSNNQLKSIGTFKSYNGVKLLHILELTNNYINATDADKLAITLSNCSSLKELYLGNNNLGTAGAIAICKALKYTEILQVLSLNNNKISTEAASEICNVVNTNTNLAVLLLGSNDLQTTGVVQIANTVKSKSIPLHILSLSRNSVNEEAKENVKVMLCDLKLLI